MKEDFKMTSNIPAVQDEPKPTLRKFYTGLLGPDYLELDKQSLARGVTPFKLAQTILMDWLQQQRAADHE